jgi:hypothetical protein
VGGIKDNGDDRMKRPSKIRQCIEGELIDTYRTHEIDPLLDELEKLRSQVNLDNSNPTGTKPFPSLEEFRTWLCFKSRRYDAIYEYFSQFRYETEVMPEVGKEYEFHDGVTWVRYKLNSFNAGHGGYYHIRPIQTPTRESIIEKARTVLSHEEIKILTGGEPVLGPDNLDVSTKLLCKVKLMDDGEPLGKFWQEEKDFGTDKVSSAFQYGNGHRAYANDFPEGTEIVITASVFLPDH